MRMRARQVRSSRREEGEVPRRVAVATSQRLNVRAFHSRNIESYDIAGKITDVNVNHLHRIFGLSVTQR